MNFGKTKYRVLEVTMGDGRNYFYPESKGLFTWKRMMTGRDADVVSQHNTLKGANDFLAEFHDRTRKNSIVKTEPHNFDIVFHKLKND